MKLTGSFYESLDQWVDWQGTDGCDWDELMGTYCEEICDIPCFYENSFENNPELCGADLPYLLPLKK